MTTIVHFDVPAEDLQIAKIIYVKSILNHSWKL